jgi:peroxiredoxin
MRTWKRAVLTASFAMGIALGCRAAELKIGDKAPDWSAIPGIDDRDHALSDYKKAGAIVMVFTCNHCPVARAYEDRLIAFHKDYERKGVRLIAVNVNNLPADRLDKMKERAAAKGFPFPYLYDASQKMGHDYGARVTPHFFVLDGERRLAYRGAMDDSQRAERVKARHLRDAVDALLAGRKPARPDTRPFGCSVKYEKKKR